MKTSRILPLLILAGLSTFAVPARAATPDQAKRTEQIKNDPAVLAAKQKRDDADKALQAAQAKNDKKAIEEAQKEKDAATKELSDARKAAVKAASAAGKTVPATKK